MDGETLDVSGNGLGLKMKRGPGRSIDDLLEQLVEDRLSVQVVLRLPEGSVSAEGELMWWGLLGDEDGFAIRAGVLLSKGWSPADWQLIEKSIRSV